MGRSNFDDVGDFHHKMGLANVTHDGPGPKGPDDAHKYQQMIDFRVDFMREELQEFVEACAMADDAAMFDALLDLVYVAEGTAQLLGYPWQQGWDLVQEANMKKERGVTKRGNTEYDVTKPEGWTPPDIEGLLLEYGY